MNCGKNKILILTDSNSGMTQSIEGLCIVPMPVIIEQKIYFEDQSISREDFFTKMNQGMSISTSQPNLGTLIEIIEEKLKWYDQIVYIPMSSGLSGSMMNAKILENEYNNKFYVVDNHRISSSLKQSVIEALIMVKNGYTACKIQEVLEQEKFDSSIYLYVNALDYLKKGGRVSKTVFSIVDKFEIKPVLQIQGNEIELYKITRGKKAAQKMIVKAIQKELETKYKGQKVNIIGAHSSMCDEGRKWSEYLENYFPKNYIGTDILPLSICCHTGPEAFAVCCCVDEIKEHGYVDGRKIGY